MNQIFFQKGGFSAAESTILWLIVFLDSLGQWESDGATH